MKRSISLALFVLIASCMPAFALVEAYGTFECMGVTADIPAGYTAATSARRESSSTKAASGARAGRRPGGRHRASSRRASSTSRPARRTTSRSSATTPARVLIHTDNCSGSTRADITIPRPSATVYVSPSGSDSGAGTLGGPLRDARQGALRRHRRQARLHARRDLLQRRVTPTANGAAGSPIVIQRLPRRGAGARRRGPRCSSTPPRGPRSRRRSTATRAPARVKRDLRRKSDGEVFRALMMATAAEVTSATSAGLHLRRAQHRRGLLRRRLRR